jgi:Tfp pilus assembly protein PilV
MAGRRAGLRADGRAGERGFSVIEVLIAAGIFLIIAVGILPLFAHSITNNLSGREATDSANYSRSRVEQVLRAPFDNVSLAVPAGSTVLTTTEYWSLTGQAWKAGAPTTADPAAWTRTTQVRQYSVTDLVDNGVLNTPLDGGADAGQVHLKEIVVTLQNVRAAGPLGAGKTFTLRMLKSK